MCSICTRMNFPSDLAGRLVSTWLAYDRSGKRHEMVEMKYLDRADLLDTISSSLVVAHISLSETKVAAEGSGYIRRTFHVLNSTKSTQETTLQTTIQYIRHFDEISQHGQIRNDAYLAVHNRNQQLSAPKSQTHRLSTPPHTKTRPASHKDQLCQLEPSRS